MAHGMNLMAIWFFDYQIVLRCCKKLPNLVTAGKFDHLLTVKAAKIKITLCTEQEPNTKQQHKWVNKWNVGTFRIVEQWRLKPVCVKAQIR